MSRCRSGGGEKPMGQAAQREKGWKAAEARRYIESPPRPIGSVFNGLCYQESLDVRDRNLDVGGVPGRCGRRDQGQPVP